MDIVAAIFVAIKSLVLIDFNRDKIFGRYFFQFDSFDSFKFSFSLDYNSLLLSNNTTALKPES